MEQFNISFIGAGRVGGALCRKLFQSGANIIRVVSRDEAKGRQLAGSCNAEWSRELSFSRSAEIIIAAVPDHALESVLDRITCSDDAIVAHTAGSLGLDVFPRHITRKAVFYPLQTFSGSREIDFNELPFFIEAPDDYAREKLKALAESTGAKVHFADTEHRKSLHLAAVFLCNFTNHMLSLGTDIGNRAGFDAEVFKPLITETFSKALEFGPQNSQTGPAVRNDINVIEKHLELLSFSPEYRKLYREITDSIIKYHKRGGQ